MIGVAVTLTTLGHDQESVNLELVMFWLDVMAGAKDIT